MFGLGPQEFIVIFLIVLIIFGPKKLPEIAKALGKGINNFKKAANSITEEIKESANIAETNKETIKKR